MVSLVSFFNSDRFQLTLAPAHSTVSFNQWKSNYAEHWQIKKKKKECAQTKLKWDELYPASLYSGFSVNMSNVGQHGAGAGQPCHMKMSLQIKKKAQQTAYLPRAEVN